MMWTNHLLPPCFVRCLMRHAGTMKWEKVVALGTSPSARSAHSATLVGGRYIYVFGGWDGDHELGDLHVLDTGGRACACAVVLAPHHVRVITDTLNWSRPITTGQPPSARHFHSACAMANRLYVFGGFDGERWKEDTVALDLGA